MTLRKAQLLSFGVAVLLGLTCWVQVVAKDSNLRFGDGYEYDLIARTLLNHRQFYAELARAPWEASAARPPGYPLFLAAVYTLAGKNPYAVTLLQVLLFGVLAAAVCTLAAKLFDSLSAGLVGGLLCGTWLTGIVVSNTLHPDLLFALGVLLCFWLVLGGEHFSARRLAAAFLVAAGLTYLKPEGLVLPLILGLAAWLKAQRLRSIAPAWLAGVLVFVLLLTPWCYRNHLVFGVWDFSNKGNTTLLEWDAALVEVGLQHKSLDQVRKELWNEVAAEIGVPADTPRAQLKVGQAARKVFFRHVLAHPGAYALRWTAATLAAPLIPDRILWFQLFEGHIDVGSVREAYYQGGLNQALQTLLSHKLALLIILQALQKLLVLVMALVGFLAALRLPKVRPWALATACFVLLHCLLLGPDAMGRLMLIADPLLLILAAGGFLRKRLQQEEIAQNRLRV